MMHGRCNGYHVTDGSCSCGWFYNNNNNSLSMMTSAVPVHNSYDDDGYYYSSSSSSSVDCTLSLGTPSTRLNDNNATLTEKKRSKFCSWNFLQPSKSHDSSSSNKTNRNASNSYSGNGDTQPGRRCAKCDTTSTPLWRNGPKGPKSLCNACGIRYKKEERRAAAAAAATANNNDIGNVAGAVDGHHMLNSSWVHYSQNQMMPYVSSSAYGNDFSFIEDNNMDDSGNPYLSWSLNVH